MLSEYELMTQCQTCNPVIVLMCAPQPLNVQRNGGDAIWFVLSACHATSKMGCHGSGDLPARMDGINISGAKRGQHFGHQVIFVNGSNGGF